MNKTDPPDVKNQIREIVARVLNKPAAEITPDARLFEELDADSLSSVEILAVLDKKFNLDLPEEKLVHIERISQLTDLVLEELRKKTN